MANNTIGMTREVNMKAMDIFTSFNQLLSRMMAG